MMLCNKADIDDARDEVHIVNTLQVERLVNEARFKYLISENLKFQGQVQ